MADTQYTTTRMAGAELTTAPAPPWLYTFPAMFAQQNGKPLPQTVADVTTSLPRPTEQPTESPYTPNYVVPTSKPWETPTSGDVGPPSLTHNFRARGTNHANAMQFQA